MSDILEDLKMRLVLDSSNIFYTTIMYSLEVYLSEEVPTAGTNGREIIFNPSFLGGLSKPEQEFLLLHEILHVCYQHMFRREERDHVKWNIACDHAINLELIDAGKTFIEGGVADKQYAGMSAEEIYPLLPEPPQDFEPDLQVPEGSPEETEALKDEVRDLVIQATQQATLADKAGCIPQSIVRQVEEWLNPVLPWYSLLQKYMTSKCKEDYSWSKRNRRFRDVYLPALYSEQVGNVHFFIDGSCSVSDEDFALQVNQILWIKKNINPKEIRIIVFNTHIVDEFVFSDSENIDVTFSARGGTDIQEIVQYMEKNTAEVNIIFTDGYFRHVPMEKVSDDILWIIYENPSFQYDRGKVLYI